MKIHCIEGLGCYYLRPLTKAVKSLNLGVEVVTYPWTVDFRNIDSVPGDIFCFHSFGLRAFEQLLAYRHGIYFILDGRMPPWGTPYKGLQILPNMDKVYNYWQTGFIRGYPIEGAKNEYVKGFSHYRMPQNPAFLFKLMEVVKTSNASV